MEGTPACRLRLLLLLLLGVATGLTGDAPAFAVAPCGARVPCPPFPAAAAAVIPPPHRRLRAPCGERGAACVRRLSGSDGSAPPDGGGGASAAARRAAKMRELRADILVDWLRIMALTLSAQRPDDECVVDTVLAYLCAGGEVARDGPRTGGASITFPKFEAAVKRMRLVEEYWDDVPKADARDGAIGQMFDLLAQGQPDVSRRRMKEVLLALNISASTEGTDSRALYGTQHAAAPSANVTGAPTTDGTNVNAHFSPGETQGAAVQERGQEVGAGKAAASAQGAAPASGGGGPMQWRYFRYNRWYRYDANATQLLESALAAGQSSVALTLRTSSASAAASGGACEYVVRFDDPADAGSFSQLNTRTGHVRAVRRATAASFRRALVPDLLTAPRLEPLVEAALRNAQPLLLQGGTFVLRDEIALSANRAHLHILGVLNPQL
jgi:hypothetical protein